MSLMNRPDLATRVTQVERDCKERAAFHVYHRSLKTNKVLVDAIFAGNLDKGATFEDAEQFVLRNTRGRAIVGTVIPTGTI